MTDPARPALLWDVMGTLVRDPFYEDVPAFFGMSLQELIDAKHPTLWGAFERGAIDEAELARRFFKDGRAFDLGGLKECMSRGFELLSGVEALLSELSALGAEQYALSNYAPWYTLIEERTALSRFLEWRFVSCDTGVRKPDPEAFLGPARALGRAPGACLLVDDRRENCAAAEAVGIPAVFCEGSERLRTDLARRGFPEITGTTRE